MNWYLILPPGPRGLPALNIFKCRYRRIAMSDKNHSGKCGFVRHICGKLWNHQPLSMDWGKICRKPFSHEICFCCLHIFPETNSGVLFRGQIDTTEPWWPRGNFLPSAPGTPSRTNSTSMRLSGLELFPSASYMAQKWEYTHWINQWSQYSFKKNKQLHRFKVEVNNYIDLPYGICHYEHDRLHPCGFSLNSSTRLYRFKVGISSCWLDNANGGGLPPEIQKIYLGGGGSPILFGESSRHLYLGILVYEWQVV